MYVGPLAMVVGGATGSKRAELLPLQPDRPQPVPECLKVRAELPKPMFGGGAGAYIGNGERERGRECMDGLRGLLLRRPFYIWGERNRRASLIASSYWQPSTVSAGKVIIDSFLLTALHSFS